MRRATNLLLIVFLLLVGAACDTTATNEQPPAPQPTPTTGTITGVVSLPAGAAGSVQNTRIAIYSNFDDWLNDRVLRSASAGGGGNYTFNNVTPGTYYLDAWKDNNNNRAWDRGDFVGVYGSGTYPTYQLSPFSVQAGQSTVINIEMIIVP